MKTIKTFIAVVLTVSTLSYSKPSQAVVSLATGGTALIGLSMMGVGVVGGVVATAIVGQGCRMEGCYVVLVPVVIGAGIAAIGLLILDGEQQIEFKALTKAEAAKLGITGSELAAYNEELDQANMLLSDVAEEMSKLEKPSAEDSINAWKQVKDLVSSETFTVMQKISAQQ